MSGNVAPHVERSLHAEEAPLQLHDNRRVTVHRAGWRWVRDGLVVPKLALVALVAAACSSSPAVDVSWHDAQGYRWRALAVPSRGHAGFTALDASRTGVAHRNDVDDEHAMANRNLLLGAGVAIGDVDGDGRPDLFLASVERPAALYHNDGDFRFTDVTAASGIDASSLATTGAVFADVDGDGDLDLLAGTLGGPVALWLNDGQGKFHDATEASGLVGGYAATTLALADVDGNGSLDLYVATYKKRNALDAYPPEARAADQVVQKVGDHYQVADAWKSEYRIDVRPDLGGIVRSQRAEPDLLFLNDGKGHFTRVSTSGPRFRSADGAPLAEEPDYFTLAARFYDVNGDGAPDLYACNDFEDPDQLWLNDGAGNFRLSGVRAIRETSNTCMSVDFGDVNRDGHVDIFTTDMLSPTLAGRQRQHATNTPLPKQVGISNEPGQWMQNTLQLSRGDGTWAQVADYAGVAATDWSWGSAFVDVDLDGFEDLLVVNGHRWDIRDADTYERIRTSVPRVPWNREQGEFPRSATRSVALRNNHDVTFRDVSAEWGFGKDEAISQGLALADLDGDGDLDVVVTRLDAAPALFRNESVQGRIAVRLRGAPPNVGAIGATVTLRAPSLPAQTREVTAGGYYLSGSDTELSFATGTDSLVSIEVRWRDGRVSRIESAVRNRLYEISEGSEAPSAAPRDVPADSAPPLFEDATALLRGQVHVDSTFDDYRRQPLLPNSFSQLGPGVSWIDLDRDGREDLVVGAGRGGALALLRNTPSGFTALSAPPPTRWDLTTILPLPDSSGGTMLVAGEASYEAASPVEALGIPSVVGFRVGRTGGVERGAVPSTVAAPESASVGALAVGDVNGDGLLDLVVAPRVIPGSWPYPAPTRLYLRTATGGFTLDATNSGALSALGLLSSVLLTDLDGDGWPELVAAAEWGPVRILHNEHGRFRDVTRAWGMGDVTSRWNGLAAGDFDGDGRLDLVATSWGLNIPWQATPDRPYTLVLGDFGAGGPGLLFARRDSASGKEMPLEPLDKLGAALRPLAGRTPTFASFAAMSVDDVLGDAASRTARVGATTFAHMLFLNRGDHFEGHPLPGASQYAPAFGTVVADFDGDGKEDLFLAQNFSATERMTMRFDAGVGLLLRGDGRGGFAPLGVRESGIFVLGDQRGAAAADYDGDGRVDLAVSQNGAANTLWHNIGAAPGIRVVLEGDRGNPLAIGAQLQLVRGSARGPVREVRAGSGYWSMDGGVTVLASSGDVTAVHVRWPGGAERDVPIAAGQRVVRIRPSAP